MVVTYFSFPLMCQQLYELYTISFKSSLLLFLTFPKWQTISKLTDTFSRIVYKAFRKYINPTRYCQIAQTENIEKEDISEANLLADKKKTSVVDKIHYQKHRSEDIAAKSKKDWINLNIKLNRHQSLI